MVECGAQEEKTNIEKFPKAALGKNILDLSKSIECYLLFGADL